jgi:aminoglycoside phosphotransferase (APT) family kinase protein
VATASKPIDGDEGRDLIDLPRVEAWLDEHAPGAGSGPLTARIIGGGSTNAVFLLTRGTTRTVLRRPPRVPRPDSEKILAREARILRALDGTDVPTPAFIGHCEDHGVTGVAFCVMGHAPGWVSTGKEDEFPSPYDRPGRPREQLAYQLVEGIARLANVDHRAIGLGDYGKPDRFLERQVERWLHQLETYRETEDYRGRDLPGLAYVGDWLRANVVTTPRDGIIHGDYGFANVIFAHEPEARLAANVDWELSTIGDPLLDLGWIAYGFRSRHDPQGAPGGSYWDASLFPTREDLCEYYADRTGLPIDGLDYYLVLAQYKLAVLLERKWAEYQAGKKPRSYGEFFGDMVLRLLRQAEATARRSTIG